MRKKLLQSKIEDLRDIIINHHDHPLEEVVIAYGVLKKRNKFMSKQFLSGIVSKKLESFKQVNGIDDLDLELSKIESKEGITDSMYLENPNASSEARKNIRTASRPDNKYDEYPALKFIAGFYTVIGYIASLGLGIGILVILFEERNWTLFDSAESIIYFSLRILGAIVGISLFFGAAELLKLLIRIERNTRR